MRNVYTKLANFAFSVFLTILQHFATKLCNSTNFKTRSQEDKKSEGGSSSAEGASAAKGSGDTPPEIFSIFSTLKHVFLHF